MCICLCPCWVTSPPTCPWVPGALCLELHLPCAHAIPSVLSQPPSSQRRCADRPSFAVSPPTLASHPASTVTMRVTAQTAQTSLAAVSTAGREGAREGTWLLKQDLRADLGVGGLPLMASPAAWPLAPSLVSHFSACPVIYPGPLFFVPVPFPPLPPTFRALPLPTTSSPSVPTVPPQVVTPPQESIQVSRGQTVTFTCVATGVPPPSLIGGSTGATSPHIPGTVRA